MAQRSEREGATRIIEILRDHAHTAYLAGGCVRDELFGVEPKDYDVATSARPDQIDALFRKTASVGASFGVMLVRDFGPTIEVATFRADGPYGDKRRPDHVEFSSPELDAQRRDFTVNALFLDPFAEDGSKVIDFVGGLDDIESRTLRAVGDPDARLNEDHLRALRAVRFAARYGLTIEDNTKNAIRAHASALSGVSVERIGEEVRRMMAHPSRAKAAALIFELGLESAIFGSSTPEHDLTTLRDLDDHADAVTALAAWRIDREGRGAIDSESVPRWRVALNLSNEDAEALRVTNSIAQTMLINWGDLPVAKQKRAASRPRAIEALRLVRALNPHLADLIEQDVAMHELDGVGIDPDPFVTGESLIAIGLTPGPAFKDILDAVYDAQLEGTVETTDQALELAQQIAREGPSS